MGLYNVTVEVLEYIAFTVLPILFVSGMITMLFWAFGVPCDILVIATCILVAKNLYNFYSWLVLRRAKAEKRVTEEFKISVE